ncbi:hypothetical protein J2X90_004523 [Variovorax paradoxus]|nr:hypothetical protein [Variovorax paradoxus]MDQ0026696.1 hypothetical protein [Variovorax paradoxus]
MHALMRAFDENSFLAHANGDGSGYVHWPMVR